MSDVREWLSRCGNKSADEVVDALQHDQLRRWEQGERIPAEAYLQLLSARVDDFGDRALDLIYGEFLLRRQGGESPSLVEYEWRFPLYAEQLRLLVNLDDELTFESPAHSANGCPSTLDSPSQADAQSIAIRLPVVPGYSVVEEIG